MAGTAHKLKPASVGRGRPWATVIIAAAAVGAWAWPAVGGALVYERVAILGGQAWRLWSGHGVHFGASHLFWNLAVFVTAGAWLEGLRPRTTRWFLAAAPVAISGALLAFGRELACYGGLSGLATGLVVLLALDRLWTGQGEPRWVWVAVLGLVATKVLVEAISGETVFAHLVPSVRVVPLVHVTGVAAALTAFFIGHRKIWLR